MAQAPMTQYKTHHGWCNGVNPLKAGPVPAKEVDECHWCGGDRGLHKNYSQEGKTQDQLQQQHFPNVVKIA